MSLRELASETGILFVWVLSRSLFCAPIPGLGVPIGVVSGLVPVFANSLTQLDRGVMIAQSYTAAL